MNAKEILKGIKALFEDVPTPEPAPTPAPEPVAVEMKEYSLADGTKVMLDKLEVGGKVTINDAPAPMGEHILADGTKIELDTAGMITSIEAPEPVEVVAPVEAAQPVAPVQLRDERVDALQNEIKQLKQGFAQMIELVEKLTETPAEDPIEPQKTQFGQMAETKRERIEKVTKLLTQIKNK